MATIWGSVAANTSKYDFRIEWSEDSVDVANNRSLVTAHSYARRTSTFSSDSVVSTDGRYLNVGGTESTTTGRSLLTTQWADLSLIANSVWVTHNADGTGSCYIGSSATLGGGGGYGPTSGSAGTTVGLTTIPRASQPTLSSTNFNIGSDITIYTNRASSSFTHTVALHYGTHTVTLATGVGASWVWDTDVDLTLYEDIPNANSGTGHINLSTYSGATLIGTKDVNFTANVVNSNPTFTNFTYADQDATTTALTGNNQTLIAGFSHCRAIITAANKATALNQATMSKYTFAVAGNTSVDGAFSSGSTVNIDMVHVLNSTLNVYAVDSRSNSTLKSIVATTWLAYTPITIASATAVRTGGIGEEVTLTYAGVFWNHSFGTTTNTVKTHTYRYKKTTDASWTNGTTNIDPTVSSDDFSKSIIIAGDDAHGFNAGYAYNIEVTATDELSTTTYAFILPSAKPQIAFGVGTGVAVGAFYDRSVGGDLQVGGVNLMMLLHPVGTIYTSYTLTTHEDIEAIFGGTWETFATGRVLVGVNAADADFEHAGHEAGGKTHSHSGSTGGQSQDHTHAFGKTLNGSGYVETSPTGSGTGWAYTYSTGGASQDHSHSLATGSGTVNSTLQPSIAVYMYKRTA